MEKLKAESYWKWRHKIEEMNHADTKLLMSRLQYSHMEKDLEIARLKTLQFKQTIKMHEDNQTLAKKEYEDIKLELENEVGHSLNGFSIDDISYEVRKLES